MAVKTINMSVIAYANGFTCWHYDASRDQIEQVLGKGFFNPYYTMANSGDIIYITKDGDTYIRVFEIKDKTVRLKEAK